MPRSAPVVREWISDLTFKQQTVLLSALRGCDGIPKEDISKQLTRSLRGVLLYDGCPPGTDCDFMRPCNFLDVVPKFTSLLDHYPVHWLMHFTHATEIIGYKHPEGKVASTWWYVYTAIVEALHLEPESERQLDRRLA